MLKLDIKNERLRTDNINWSKGAIKLKKKQTNHKLGMGEENGRRAEGVERKRL